MMEDTPAQLRKLFIGGLDHEIDDSGLEQYYSRFGVVVDSIVIREQDTKISRGFGFVTFATMEMANNAMYARPHVIAGKEVEAKRAIARDQMLQPQDITSPPAFLLDDAAADCKLAIYSVHFSLFNGNSTNNWKSHSIDQLRIYFERYGPVEQIEIVGHPQSFGFVAFENRQHAQNCLADGSFHFIEGSLVEVREFPQINAHCGNRHGNRTQCYQPRGNYHHRVQHANHYRQPRRIWANSVNCSPEYTSTSEGGRNSPRCKNNNTAAIVPAFNELDEFPPLSPTFLAATKLSKSAIAAIVASILKDIQQKQILQNSEQQPTTAIEVTSKSDGDGVTNKDLELH